MDNQNSYCYPEWVAIFVAFFSILFLGFIAIFQDWIRSCFRKPKLKISIKLEPPDSHKIAFRKRETGEFVCDSYYFRFNIENEGNCHMEDVDVIATEKWQKNEDGKYEKDHNFLPLNLVWSHIRKQTMPRIYRQLFKYCDFGHIIESKYANLERFGIPQSSKIIFRLDVAIEPNTGSHIIKPGDYKIKIKIAANNLKPKTKIYNLIFKDEWLDDEREMFAGNISIKEI